MLAAAAHQRAQRGDHLRPHRDVGIDHLIVGVGELALDAGADASQRRREAGLHVTGQVEIHQPIGGADLHFGIVIVRGLDQRIEAALRCRSR